jgi:hypothetical protein
LLIEIGEYFDWIDVRLHFFRQKNCEAI